MPTVVGIDEAGYGPMLGPLVVGATIWHVAPEHIGENWWRTLKAAVCRKPSKGEFRFCVDDSKKVFDQKKGIPSLERSIYAFLRATGVRCETLGHLLSTLTSRDSSSATDLHEDGASQAIQNPKSEIQNLAPACATDSIQTPNPKLQTSPPAWLNVPAAIHPWYRDLARPIPFDPQKVASDEMVGKLTDTMAKVGIQLRALAAQVVPETTFNDRMRQTRNKAAINVEHVFKLVDHAVRTAPDPEIHFCIDRLGGRTDYREILQTTFPDRDLQILSVTENCSSYRLAPRRGAAPDAASSRNPSDHRTPVQHAAAKMMPQCTDWHFSFSVEADSHFMPVALAGMLCKYLRELLMHQFNAYWAVFDPGLRPTAGYYTDARRFLNDISPLLSQTGLRSEDFVRVS